MIDLRKMPKMLPAPPSRIAIRTELEMPYPYAIEEYKGKFCLVKGIDTAYGYEMWFPASDCEGCRIAERMNGFGFRWTMPGYMDCGEWEVFEDENDFILAMNEEIETWRDSHIVEPEDFDGF